MKKYTFLLLILISYGLHLQVTFTDAAPTMGVNDAVQGRVQFS
jgi:hypothetical protein